MKKSPSLVFVVGAGASKDFGNAMPVGTELANIIQQNLNNEFGGRSSHFSIEGPISNAISSSGTGGFRTDHVNAANRIRRGIHSKESIDDMLDDWRDTPGVLEVGKLAIAQAILEAERVSDLAKNGDTLDGFLTTIGRLRDTWLGQVIRYCGPGKSRRLLPDILSNIGFVIFNYDRCIERMLVGELCCNTDFSVDQAQTFVNQMAIVHPYGHLGPSSGENSRTTFGADGKLLWHMAKGIRTYTEEEHDISEMKKLQTLLSNADKTAFLGFGFHPRNLSLLVDHDINIDGLITGASIFPDIPRLNAAKKILFPDLNQGASDNLFQMAYGDFIYNNRAILFS